MRKTPLMPSTVKITAVKSLLSLTPARKATETTGTTAVVPTTQEGLLIMTVSPAGKEVILQGIVQKPREKTAETLNPAT